MRLPTIPCVSRDKPRRELFTRTEQRILYNALIASYPSMDKETRRTAKFLIRDLFV